MGLGVLKGLKGLALSLLLAASVNGCASLDAAKSFPKEDRQKLVDQFERFESRGFGGYYSVNSSVEEAKGKWSGKLLVLFVGNSVAEYPKVLPVFEALPAEWKAADPKSVDTLAILEFRGGDQEKFLNQEPTELKLTMRIFDVKQKTLLRTITVKKWPPTTARNDALREIPDLKEILEKRKA